MTEASICTIGDEILIGQIVDTNSSAISRKLNSLGIKVTRMISIADDRKDIIESLSEELRTHQVVIVTGGLGPTKDDITKPALAELYGSKNWYEHEGQLQVVREILRSRGLDMLDINRAQASVPEGCEVIVNRRGTAPIMVFRFPASRFGHDAVLYSMPGVPFETEAALDEVMEDIRKYFEVSDIYHKCVMTYGLAESALSKKIEAWEDALPDDMHLAYLPNTLSGVRLRLSIYGGEREEQQRRIDAEIAKLDGILGDMIYSHKDESLQSRIGELLRRSGKTLCAAESCTGGMISSLITSVRGSSQYYLGSVTSYAVAVKEAVLGVPSEIIDNEGVVSSTCAAAMAQGVRRLMGADYAVATTGVAGPDGGTEENPVGTVWVAVCSASSTVTEKFQYKNDRERNIQRFSASALNLLRLLIARENPE